MVKLRGILRQIGIGVLIYNIQSRNSNHPLQIKKGKLLANVIQLLNSSKVFMPGDNNGVILINIY